MALRNILKEGDERLRKKSRPVTDFNERLWTLLDDMYETMKDGGVGIAAPQVGVLRRAVVIDGQARAGQSRDRRTVGRPVRRRGLPFHSRPIWAGASSRAASAQGAGPLWKTV